MGKTGKMVIPLVYDNVNDFHEGLAAVVYDGKIGFINSRGRFVIAPRFDALPIEFRFEHGLAYVYQDEIEGYIDTKENGFGRGHVDPM